MSFKLESNSIEQRKGVAILVLIVSPTLADNGEVTEDEDYAVMAVLEAGARAEVTSYLTDRHTKDKPPLRNGQFLRRENQEG